MAPALSTGTTQPALPAGSNAFCLGLEDRQNAAQKSITVSGCFPVKTLGNKTGFARLHPKPHSNPASQILHLETKTVSQDYTPGPIQILLPKSCYRLYLANPKAHVNGTPKGSGNKEKQVNAIKGWHQLAPQHRNLAGQCFEDFFHIVFANSHAQDHMPIQNASAKTSQIQKFMQLT